MKNQRMVQATVVSITDGDTFKVLRRGKVIKIRIACIDTPEMSVDPWGQRAKDALTGMLRVGSAVSLMEHDADRYGRIVAEVYKSNGRNIGLELVKKGYAEVYDKYAYQCDEDKLTKFERRAQRQGKGIWTSSASKKKKGNRNTDSRERELQQADWEAEQRRQDLLGDYEPMPINETSNINIPDTTGSQRITCSQLSSQSDARKWLNQGHSYLDWDGDGVPCESLPAY